MCNLWNFFGKNKFVVLMYHHVGPVTDEKERKYFISPEMFEKQIDLLITNGFHLLDLSEFEDAYLHNKELPQKSVLITLDDGWLDNYEYAYPIILKKNIPVTIFLSTSLIGKQQDIMTWEHIREMEASGYVSFSSHGCNHLRLRDLSDDEISSELIQSKKTLESFLRKPVVSFCYPFGAFDQRVRNLVFDAGYKLDFGTRKGMNRWPWRAKRPLLRAHVLDGESLDDYYRELTRGRK